LAPTPNQPHSGDHHQAEEHGRHKVRESGSVRAQPGFQYGLLDDHFAGNVTEQSSARENEHRKAPDQRHDDLAADDDDGNADHQSEDEQLEASLGGGCHGNDVVEAHHKVGHDDGPYRREHAVARLDLVLALVLLGDQLHSDPDEEHSADQSNPWV